MTSKVNICNMALLSLGTRTIASLDERTPEAMYCAQHYDLALEEALRGYPWNFAQGRARPARVDLPVTWEREYPFAYAYPADCLHLHTLISESGEPSQDFTVAHYAGRTLILTSVESAIAAFTMRVDDTSRFDPLFIRALAARLACHLALPILKGNTNALKVAEQAYGMALAHAKTADAREGKPYASPDGG